MCLSFSALNRFVVFAVVRLYAFVVNSSDAHWRSTKAGQGTYQGSEGCETAQKTTNPFRRAQQRLLLFPALDLNFLMLTTRGSCYKLTNAPI